jgi:NAD(P)-dependent dehydrogenase (short-subunit alcohol dehydrogenase family)
MSDPHRVAIVTGGSRGLGQVIAGVLATHGFDLVLGARHVAPLADAAQSIRERGRRVAIVAGDVADRSVRTRLVEQARTLGALHVLVNNASELGGIGPLATLDVARLERVLQVNLVAPIGLAQLAMPLLAEHRGLIVNVSSDAAHGAYPGWGAYGASKAALELATRTLAAEIEPARVSAVTVDPGDLRTRMHQEAFPGEDISDRPLPEITVPFWAWFFAQEPGTLDGQRFRAQAEEAPWLQRA